MNNYKYAFMLANIIESGGNLKFDIPFPIYSQNISYNNRNFYTYIDKSLKDCEVLVYFAYDINDEAKVKEFKGYLGDDWSVVQKIEKVMEKWAVKKEDALAVSVQDKVEPTKTVVTKYDGADKDETVHPYKGE